MKSQIIKTAVILISLIVIISCNNMKSQTEELVNLNRVQLNDELQQLVGQKIITDSEFKQLNNRLNADFDFYLKHQDIDLSGLEKMFFKTIKSFENIKINRQIFIVISNTTYHTITSQIAMRSFPGSIKQEDYLIQSQLNTVMNNWFESYQSDSEKIEDLIAQINKARQMKIYPDISDFEYEEILTTITKIKIDTKISDNELKKILIDGTHKYCNKSNNSNLSILNIYESINRIKKLGIQNELLSLYEKNWKKRKEPDYLQIKHQVTNRFRLLLNEGFITKQKFQELTKKIIDDVEFCENNTDKTQIKAKMLNSLKKLKNEELDTEDREAIVDWYFILSQKNKIDIKSDLNEWMYDFDPN